MQITQETILQQITYSIKNYFTYTNIKSNLNEYFNITFYLIDEICYIIKNINFNYTDILEYIVNCIEYLINILKYLQNYNIEEAIEYILFYIEYIIDCYYYRYNAFNFIYKCIYSIDYFNLCCKHFLNINYGYNEQYLFIYFLYTLFSLIIYAPMYYGILKFVLDKGNNILIIIYYFANFIHTI
uniref:Uncharacterized protein n=1 Tax=Babesia gibsoni TaxID=33632 RepID=A0A6M8NTQ6_BABGI|nr:hypothetical protein [Babesia gibsoni]